MIHLFAGQVKDLEPEAFKAAMAGDYLLIDVRTKEEYTDGHIKTAVNIPLDALPGQIHLINGSSGKQILLYCFSGARSISAALYLNRLGIKNICNLSGGILAWSRVFG